MPLVLRLIHRMRGRGEGGGRVAGRRRAQVERETLVPDPFVTRVKGQGGGEGVGRMGTRVPSERPGGEVETRGTGRGEVGKELEEMGGIGRGGGRVVVAAGEGEMWTGRRIGVGVTGIGIGTGTRIGRMELDFVIEQFVRETKGAVGEWRERVREK